MMPEAPIDAADWLAVALMCGVLASAFGAATARSLFGMTMLLTVAAALGAAAVLAMGAEDAALAQALWGLGLSPLILLAVLLLSARTAKTRDRGRPWLSLIGAGAFVCVCGVALVLAASESPYATTPAQSGGVGFWIVGLVLVAAAACVGLLGYGERGAFERAPDLERDR
jgi:uncharacterized MnhB-related membrane protein